MNFEQTQFCTLINLRLVINNGIDKYINKYLK